MNSILLILFFTAVSGACAAVAGDQAGISGAREMQGSLRVDLSKYGSKPTGLEFSHDCRYLLCWWLPQPPVGDYDKILGKCVVLDMSGHVVPDATDGHGQIKSDYVMLFPTTAAREHFAWFLEDTNDLRVTMWGFSENYSNGLRVLRTGNHFAPGRGQLWRLVPNVTQLWDAKLPEEMAEKGCMGFLGPAEKDRLLVAFEGVNAYVLSANNGEVIDRFRYVPPETDAQQLATKRRFGLHAELGDPSLSFFAGCLSFDRSRGLLACGAAYGKRILVLSVDPPHSVVFEAHADENPERPRGGVWSVTSLVFNGGGQYLVAGYKFSGRMARKQLTAIEIYNTKSWHSIWSTQDDAISPVVPPCISTDGTLLALIKGSWLEVTHFPGNE